MSGREKNDILYKRDSEELGVGVGGFSVEVPFKLKTELQLRLQTWEGINWRTRESGRRAGEEECSKLKTFKDPKRVWASALLQQ